MRHIHRDDDDDDDDDDDAVIISKYDDNDAELRTDSSVHAQHVSTNSAASLSFSP